MSDPVIRKGEKVTCTNGHVICEALDDVHWGDVNWGEKFGNWRQEDIPSAGSMHKPPCMICGADFIAANSWDMHFQDGKWKPRPPPGFIGG